MSDKIPEERERWQSKGAAFAVAYERGRADERQRLLGSMRDIARNADDREARTILRLVYELEKTRL